MLCDECVRHQNSQIKIMAMSPVHTGLVSHGDLRLFVTTGEDVWDFNPVQIGHLLNL